MSNNYWKPDEDAFLRANWQTLKNRELAAALKRSYGSTVSRLHQLGCKRVEMEYWNSGQTEYLIKNFRFIGDTELAEIYNRHFPKNKPWTKKHIEKKRKYLKLHRTASEIQEIAIRNKVTGRWAECAVKRWKVSQAAPIGEVRLWYIATRPIPFVKISGTWIKLAHYNWQQRNGTIPKNMVIRHKDGNPLNCEIDNLELLTKKENSLRNTIHRFPPEVKQAIWALHSLKTVIKNHGKHH